MPNELTPREAIIEINRCKIDGYAPTDWDRRCRAVEAAKNALRKQIPRKPDLNIHDSPLCPNCRAFAKKVMDDYCPECGQAIDWSAE